MSGIFYFYSMKNFTAKPDKWTKFYTYFFIVFSIALVCFIYLAHVPKAVIIITLAILFLAFLVSYLMIPKIYFERESLIIKTTFVNINIPINSIKTIEKYPKISMNVRTFGVGGIFGFFGYFNWGEVWYVTNIYKKIKITTQKNKVYMISVENPSEFLEEINKLRES